MTDTQQGDVETSHRTTPRRAQSSLALLAGIAALLAALGLVQPLSFSTQLFAGVIGFVLLWAGLVTWLDEPVRGRPATEEPS